VFAVLPLFDYFWIAGKSMPIRTELVEITTSSSMSVKPAILFARLMKVFVFFMMYCSFFYFFSDDH